MAAVENGEFWREFISMYKHSPELWQINNEKYKNKRLKEKANQNLLQKLKEVQPNATEFTLKRKLSLLKDGYRRELIRMRQSEKSARSPDEIYVPTLWFFNELSFLGDQDANLSETSVSDTETKPIAARKKNRMVAATNSTSSLQNIKTPSHISNEPRRTITKTEIEQKEKIAIAPKIITSLDATDDACVFSSTWAIMYRKLEPDQQMFANKAIMDVLYQGQLSRLNESSPLSAENSQFSTHSSVSSLTRKNAGWKN